MKTSHKFIFLGITIFLLTITTASVFINDQLIDLGGGDINDLATLNLFDAPLLIMDTVRNVPIAIFNANDTFIPVTAESFSVVSFPNTSIGFFGNVDNFDNVNDFSRFKETNLNNGSLAVAGFQGENDLGHTFGLGITSSSFSIAGMDLPNEAVTFSLAPGGTTFSNFLDQGFDWFVNKNDSVVSFDFTKVASLSKDGDLNISRNLTAINASLNFINVSNFVILGQNPVNTNASLTICDITVEGALAYSSLDWEFYGCRDKSSGAQNDFEWKKLT